MNPLVSFARQRQHVLVTGGTGFIGQALVAALLEDGHSVTVLTRQPESATAGDTRSVRYCRSLDQVSEAGPVDVVVNLAGARILGWPWSDKRKAFLMQSRVALTERLVAWMATTPTRPRLLLSGSAIGYYGVQPQDDDTALTEASPPQSIFMSDLCRQWEAAAAKATTLGVQVACMRLGFVLGHGGSTPMLLLPYRLGLGGRLGTGRQWMSWIHLRDVVRAAAWVMQTTPRADAGQQGTFSAWNFTAPEQLRQQAFSRVAGAVLHRPVFLPTPAWPIRLMLGEQSDLLLEGQRVQPARLLASGFEFAYPTMAGALADL